MMLNLYYSFIYTHLSYCMGSWFGAPSYLTEGISVLQKKCIRAIYNLEYKTYTKDYFDLSSILTVLKLYKRNVLIYMFKTINCNYDQDLLSAQVGGSDLHSITTRSKNRSSYSTIQKKQIPKLLTFQRNRNK